MEEFKSYYAFMVIFLCVSFCQGDDECKQKTSHLAPIRLKKDLLCDYDRYTRPVVNHTNSTAVVVRMILKFFSYEMHSNTISIHDWLVLLWKDDHLKWDPLKYESISQLHIASSEIWIPDLSVYNRNDQTGDPTVFTSVDCLVTSSGNVICVSPGRQDALCMPDLSKYPFDRQNCTLRMGSWIHSGESVDLNVPSSPVTLEDYIPNGDWKLLSVTVKKFHGRYSCCPNNTYPSLNYNFLIERHSATHAATVIIPALVMILLTLTTLWINAEQIERIVLSCCNLLSHITYLESLSWQLPSSGDTPPLLILYARDSLLLCAFSIVLTVFLKSVLQLRTACPLWIYSVNKFVLTNKVGQLVLGGNATLKDITAARGEEDGINIINDMNTEIIKDWRLFAKLFDRLCFIVFIISYFCMFFTFIV